MIKSLFRHAAGSGRQRHDASHVFVFCLNKAEAFSIIALSKQKSGKEDDAMAVSRENSIWGRIRTHLKTAQELILNGRYAEAMVQDREILRILVGMQMDQACLVTKSLQDDIAQLFEGRWISQKTRDNYQAIAAFGDQAQAGQNNSAQDANTSFYLLKDALEAYVDQNSRIISNAEHMSTGEREREERTEAREMRQRQETRERQAQRRASGTSRSAAASRNRSRSRSGAASRTRSASGSARRRREEPVSANIYDILKILIPVACAILLVILVRTLWTGGKSETAQTIAETTTIAETNESTSEAETTEAETAAEKIYVTTSNVNLRSAPNTDEGTQVLRTIPSGTELTVKGDYDTDWVIVDENGQDAYVNKAYIQEKTSATTAAETSTAETSAASSTAAQ